MTKTLTTPPVQDSIDAHGRIRVRLSIPKTDPHYHLLKDKTPKELRALVTLALRHAVTTVATPLAASQSNGMANTPEPQIQAEPKPNKASPAKAEFHGLGAGYLAKIQDQSGWKK